MPSASSKTSSMANQIPSIEGQDPLRVVVSMMEKKVRNLEKRKAKLVTYTKQVQSGQELVEKEQQDAVKKLEYVENNLELAKEFQGIFKSMEQEHQKLQKKEQKRAKVEMKEKSNEDRKSLVVQVLEVQAILENLDGEVKEDFVNGTKGAVKLAEDEFAKLDGIYKLITPSQNEDTDKLSEQVSTSAEHLHYLLDEKDKPILNSTYKDVFGILKKVKDSKYFETEENEEPSAEVKDQEEQVEDQEQAPTAVAESEQESEARSSDSATGQDEVRGAETYTEVPSDHAEPTKPDAVSQETSVVNGVDLPSEFSEAVADSALNFMGESEVQNRVSSSEEGKLNAASPEFIPRSLQGAPAQDQSMAAESTELEDAGEWSEGPHQGNRRGGPRGRDRGGFRGGRDSRGGRGRAGFGQNGSNYYRQDGYRREGGPRGGPRGGSARGNRGGPRGTGRGGPPRGGSSRGHHQQQQQQPQHQ